MKIYKIDDMFRGWFIGDFKPSILKTKDFEVGVLIHPKGQKWPKHYHAECKEYNLLLEGKMLIRHEPEDYVLEVGDLFVFDRFEIANPVFLEDCKILVIKVPSIPGDKIEL